MMWRPRVYGPRINRWYGRPVRYARPGCGCLFGRLISGLVALVIIVLVVFLLRGCLGFGAYYG